MLVLIIVHELVHGEIVTLPEEDDLLDHGSPPALNIAVRR
jgi:hypothetical protein